MKARLLALLLVLALSSAAQAAAPPSGLKPTRYLLDDGMVVIFQEVHSMPLVSLNLYVRSGGMYETPDTNGLSHFYEHMFFRGTPTRTGTEIKQELEGLGGTTNAETSKDFTKFFVNLPSVHVHEGLDILGDALMHANFDVKAIDLERNAVLDEYRMDLEEPGQLMQAELYSQGFASHPYKLPVIGTETNIDKFGHDDFVAWKAKYYVPERTALVVVGDFNSAELLPYIQNLFKDFKTTGVAVPSSSPEAPLTEVKKVVEDRDVKDAYVLLGFHSPSVRDKPDIYCVDVMTFLLGQGRGSLAEKVLVDHMGVAQGASADFLTQRDPGLIILEAETTADKVQAAHQALLDVIQTVRDDRFSAEDFARAKNLLISTYIMGNETNAGKADGLGFYEMIDQMAFATSYLDGIDKVTRQDVVNMANKYLGQSYVDLTVRPSQHPGGE